MGTNGAGYDTTASAAVGGTTTVIDFAPQSKGMSLLDSVKKHQEEEAEGKSAVDFALHAIIMDAQERIFSELPALVKADVPTIKIFMAYKGTPYYADDSILFRMFQKAKEVGVLIIYIPLLMNTLKDSGPEDLYTVNMVPEVWHITNRMHLRELDKKWFMTYTFKWP